MTKDEYLQRLNELTEEEFKRFNDDLGGGQQTIEQRIREYVDHPEHERRICQLLGLKTQDEKQSESAIRSASAAEKSAEIARKSMIFSGIACLISVAAVIVAIISLLKN